MNPDLCLLVLLDFLIFNPVLASPRASRSLKCGVRFSRMCLARLPFESMMQYIRHAVAGTEHSLAFEEQMHHEGFMSFSDIFSA